MSPKKLDYRANCAVCEKYHDITPKKAWEIASRKRTHGYEAASFCSPECLKLWRGNQMRKDATPVRKIQMKLDNPMRDPAVRAKVSATLRKMGHGPKVRHEGCNVMTKPEKILAEALDWPERIVVRSLKPPGSGYKFGYLIDVGNRELKIAIEVDGLSHMAYVRRELDEKKEDLLRSLGWTVLRFTNREVMEHLEDCVQTVKSTISKLKGCTHSLPTE